MNKKNKIYIALILMVVILVIGFFLNKEKQDKVFSDREITKKEIEKFIPINYSTVAMSTYANDMLIKKYEINKSTVYLLPLQPEGQGFASGNSVKILLLKYNKKLDNYYKKSEHICPGNSFIEFDYSDDIDNDGIDELFVRSSANYGGSGTNNYLEILKINNDNIIEIIQFDSNVSSMPKYYNDSKEIINVSYIWGKGETH